MDGLWTLLLYAVVIGLALFILVVRPARRARAHRLEVVSKLAPGTHVMLTSGLLATIVEIDGEEVVVDAGNGVLLRYVARAVGGVRQADLAPGDHPNGLASGNSLPESDVSDRDA